MEFPRLYLLLLVAIFLATVDYGSACRIVLFEFNFKRDLSAGENFDAADIFRLCDVDKNSSITLNELRRCVFVPHKTARTHLKQMDSDGNGELCFDEIKDHIRFDKSAAATCYQATLMKCGMRFMMYSRTHNSDQDTLCGAMQEYVDCISEETDCNLPVMVSFKHALVDMLGSGKSDSICPNINITALGQVGPYTALPCSKLVIVDCDIMFLSDLRDGIAPCESLAVYEQCIKESTDKCDDDPARYARAGSHALVSAYLGNNICP